MWIILVPMAASLVGAVLLWTGEIALPWKLIASAIVIAALALQFVPAFRVHFLIPLLMQVFVGIWGWLDLYWPRDV